VGVAKPKAQGQAIIITATKFKSAKVNAGDGPKLNQITKVAIAMEITMGTKYPAMTSANLWIGAFEP